MCDSAGAVARGLLAWFPPRPGLDVEETALVKAVSMAVAKAILAVRMGAENSLKLKWRKTEAG